MTVSGKQACSVEGCDRTAAAKGCCRKHYYRLLRHGDPLGGRTPEGKILRFYNEVVLNYDGEECLAWPYATSHGYAALKADGKSKLVCRILCEDVYGPPPTPTHQAAHACGQGHLACVAKKHLRWATPEENNADKFIHGTVLSGERNPPAKLNEAQVLEILSLRGQMSQQAIGKRFGVSDSTVSRIQLGRNWATLTAIRSSTHDR